MIHRFSGRPASADPCDKEGEAADVFRRFFHALARLGVRPRLHAPELKSARRNRSAQRGAGR